MPEMSSKVSDPLQHLIDNVSDAAIINTSLLAGGHFPSEGNQSARTVYFKGKLAVVFAFRLHKQLKALKVWPANDKNQRKKHYEAIAPAIHKSGLNFFASFVYIEAALKINGELHDALLMDWVGRQNLKEYICANLNRYANLEMLAEKLLHLHKALNNAGVALGHFHPGNIYIDGNNELKLIGYDAISFTGQQSFENDTTSVYPDYAHPSGKIPAAKTDYFAALILYLGVKALSHENVLWGRYKIGFTEGFIFSATDFANLENATVYQWMRKKKWPEIDKLLDILEAYCEVDNPDKLIPFYELLEDSNQPVSVKQETKQPDSGTIKADETIITAPDTITEAKKETIVEESLAIMNIEEKGEPNENKTVNPPFAVISAPGKNMPIHSISIENNDNTNLHFLSVADEPSIELIEEERSRESDTPVIRFWKKRKLLIAVLALLTVVISAIVTYFIRTRSNTPQVYEYVTQKDQKSDKANEEGSGKLTGITPAETIEKGAVLTDSAQQSKSTAVITTASADSNKLLVDSSSKEPAVATSTLDKAKKNAGDTNAEADKAQVQASFNKNGIDSSIVKAAANKIGAVVNENGTNRQGNIAIRKNKGQSESASFSIGAPPKE